MLLFWFVSSTMGPFSRLYGPVGNLSGDGTQARAQCAEEEGRGAGGGKILTFSSQRLGFAFHFNQFQMKLTSQEPLESQRPGLWPEHRAPGARG